MKKWGNNFEHITCEQSFLNINIQNKTPCISCLEIKNIDLIDLNYLRKRKLFFISLINNKDFTKNLYL
jgi:hypothetical protein